MQQKNIRNRVNFNNIPKPESKENILASFIGGLGDIGANVGRAAQQLGQGVATGAQTGGSAIGQGLKKMYETPEGKLALQSLIGEALIGVGQEDLGEGIQEYAQTVYTPNVQRQMFQTQQKAETEKAQRDRDQKLIDEQRKRQADIDAAVEQFKRKEEIRAEIEAPQKKRELQEEQKLEKKKAVNAFMSAQEVISGIDNLLKKDPETGAKRFQVAVGPIEGRTSGMALPTKKGEKSFQINQEIKTLLAQKALNTITEMKNASRTGATGFGAMNEKELGLIEADIASLDPRLSNKAFEASLNRIKQRMQKVMSQIDITEEDRLSLQQEDPLGIL